MTAEFIYLHGFASSPNSAKAQYIGDRFAENQRDLTIPDLNAGDFSHLTITRQLNQVVSMILVNGEESLPSPFHQSDFKHFTLIGSSLGGLIAAHIGQRYQQVQHLVLLAPAFGFLSHWLPQLGDEQLARWLQEKYLMVYHYGFRQSLPLCYDFITDAIQYKEDVLQRPVPTLILHGQYDDVIPITASQEFAKSRPWVELVELESDHSLGNVMAEIWQAIQQFCKIQVV